jgi:hypothetical protein
MGNFTGEVAMSKKQPTKELLNVDVENKNSINMFSRRCPEPLEDEQLCRVEAQPRRSRRLTRCGKTGKGN